MAKIFAAPQTFPQLARHLGAAIAWFPFDPGPRLLAAGLIRLYPKELKHAN